MHPTHNTLPERVRAGSVEMLNLHLAAAIDLHAQVKQAHWNVRGPGFLAVHQFFDTISTAVEDWSDKIAERAGALGGVAHGTLQVAVARSYLIPYPHGIAEVPAHIFAVAGSLAAFGQAIRNAIGETTNRGDVDTADLLTEISRAVDLQLWFVESHTALA